MKPQWKQLPADKTVNIPLDGGGINTSSRKYPALTTCLGHAMENAYMGFPNPIRMFVTVGGKKGIIHRPTAGENTVRIVNLDDNMTSGTVECAGEVGFEELYIKSREESAMVFAATDGRLRAVFADNNHMAVDEQPPCNFLAVVNNRLVTASAAEKCVNVYGEGEFDWNMTPTETFHVEGYKTECTGLAAFKNFLIYFTLYGMYKITWGADGIRSVETISTDVGCKTSYSIVYTGGELIWMGWSGVYSWKGSGAPKLISGTMPELDRLYFSTLHATPQALAMDGVYYLTIPYKDQQPIVFACDIERGIWHKWVYDNPMISLSVRGTMVLALNTSGVTYAINQSFHNAPVEWEYETEIDPQTKRIRLELKKDEDATVSLKLILPSGEETQLMTHPATGDYIVPPETRLSEAPVILKISGQGEFELGGIVTICKTRSTI